MTEGAGERAPTQLLARLRARLGEIEEAVLTRITAIGDPAGGSDPAYTLGLRSTVSAALEYALEAIERGEERAPPPPPALLVQARVAARNGVGLDTVLRRYFAGYALLDDFLAGQAERGGLPGGAHPAQLLQGRAAVFDRLIAAVSDEYQREAAGRRLSPEQLRAARVQRLLDGEPLDTSELGYDLSGHHLGIVASAAGVAEALRGLAATLDRRLLLVRRGDGAVWAWLGGRRPFALDRLASQLADAVRSPIALGVGEAAAGIAGWRLTHRQAAAALPIAERTGKPLVRYGEVALLAATLRDDLLASSLHQLYLAPLEAVNGGGRTLRETLRAYLASDRNVSSAAAALGVKRHTVTSRLRAIEERVGCSLSRCALEIDLTLRVDELRSSSLE